MPNKTIYIADADIPLTDRAIDIAGGLSPAVIEGLKLLVKQHEAASEGFDEIHVEDTRNGTTTTRIFSGRQLARLEQSQESVREIWSSYRTPKGNIAVVRTTRPDFVGFSQPTPSAGRGASQEFSDAARFVSQFFNPTMPNPRAGFQQAPDLNWALKLFNRRNLDNFSLGNLNAELENLGDLLFQGRAPHSDGNLAPRGFGDVIPHEEKEDDKKDGDRTPDEPASPAEPQPVETGSALEVFEDTEAMRSAAFRSADTESASSAGSSDCVGAIPPAFVTATERALNHPPVEYLDI